MTHDAAKQQEMEMPGKSWKKNLHVISNATCDSYACLTFMSHCVMLCQHFTAHHFIFLAARKRKRTTGKSQTQGTQS